MILRNDAKSKGKGFYAFYPNFELIFRIEFYWVVFCCVESIVALD